MKEVFIFTYDMRMFFQITQKLNAMELPWIALDSFSDAPDWKDIVLITAQSDLDRFKPDIPSYMKVLILNRNMSAEEMYFRVLQSLKGAQKPHKVQIGIDPGIEQNGLALFINDIYLFSEVVYNRAQIMERLRMYFSLFPCSYKIVKIGNGYGRNTRYLLRYFFSNKFPEKDVNFFLVNEKSTSKHSNVYSSRILSKHEHAAIIIAQRFGIAVTRDNLQKILNVTVPKSAIRGIQYESRLISQRRNQEFTIDSEEAKLIYLGKKSVYDSLDSEN